MRLWWLAISALLLCFGCAQAGSGQPGSPANQSAGAYGAAGNFMVPQSPVNYTAHYTINENGAESYRTVWRAGRMMRVDLDGAVSLFFLGDKAYSCSQSGARCFDISSTVGSTGAAQIFAQPDMSSAQAAETVDIGGLSGRCYLFPSAAFETHKMCFTPDGITAYDEQNGTAGSRTVEYLTELDYSASPSDFALPAQPTPAPEN